MLFDKQLIIYYISKYFCNFSSDIYETSGTVDIKEDDNDLPEYSVTEDGIKLELEEESLDQLEPDNDNDDDFEISRINNNHHKIKLEPEKLKELKCILCDQTFSGNYNLKIHFKTHGKGPFTCSSCGVKVDTIKEMKEHLKTSHIERKCAVCDEIFPNLRQLTSHLLTHGEGPFKCKLCGKEKQFMRGFLKHMKNHADNDEVQCLVCNKKMARNKLKDHMGYHTGLAFFRTSC